MSIRSPEPLTPNVPDLLEVKISGSTITASGALTRESVNLIHAALQFLRSWGCQNIVVDLRAVHTLDVMARQELSLAQRLAVQAAWVLRVEGGPLAVSDP
jgi:anti-anti-sigma regulatory factor